MSIGQENLNSEHGKGNIPSWVPNMLNNARTFIIVPSPMTHIHITYNVYCKL